MVGSGRRDPRGADERRPHACAGRARVDLGALAARHPDPGLSFRHPDRGERRGADRRTARSRRDGGRGRCARTRIRRLGAVIGLRRRLAVIVTAPGAQCCVGVRGAPRAASCDRHKAWTGNRRRRDAAPSRGLRLGAGARGGASATADHGRTQARAGARCAAARPGDRRALSRRRMHRAPEAHARRVA
jgi:hypothetical protein